MGTLRWIAYFFVIAINIFVLYSFRRDEGEHLFEDLIRGTVIPILGVIVILLSSVTVIYNIYQRIPVFTKAWNETERVNVFHGLNMIVNTSKNILQEVLLSYYICFAVFAILGALLHPFFFAFHLFDIMIGNKTLLSVVKSVWRPKYSLFLTILMFVIFVYVFATFGYIYFADQYKNSLGRGFESIWDCFVLIMDKSFKYDGGIGSYLSKGNENADNNASEYIQLDFKRLAYDNLFVILLMIIMINIVSGIIIDTFGSLRDEEKEYSENIKEFCFVCGYNREMLDKVSQNKNGFMDHIYKEHYQWNYLFYIAYILDKKETEYTGLESYLAHLIKRMDISWFPCHRAMIFNEAGVQRSQELIHKLVGNINSKVA